MQQESEAETSDVIMAVSSDSEVECVPCKFRRTQPRSGSTPAARMYNIHVGMHMLPTKQLQKQRAVEHAAETMARSCFEQGFVTWMQIDAIMSALPDEQKRRWTQKDHADQAPPRSFMTGAWARGPHVGLTRNLRAYPMVSQLLAHILQSVDPSFQFSSCTLARKKCSKPHTDSNAPGSQNLVVPCSSFQGGELWVQSDEGNITLSPQGVPGILWETTTPVRFDPRMQHATAPWMGDRVILIGYHIRHMSKLSEDDAKRLKDLGFNVGPDFA